MTPTKDLISSFEHKSRKLLSFGKAKRKLCLMVPDFENVKVEKLESADTLLARLKSKPGSN
jgi:hypothetical protein